MATEVIDGITVDFGDRQITPELKEQARQKIQARRGGVETSRPPQTRSEQAFAMEKQHQLSKKGVGTYDKLKTEYDIRKAFLDEAKKARDLLASGQVDTGPWIGSKVGSGENEKPGASWKIYQGVNPNADQLTNNIEVMQGLATQLAILKFGKADSNPAQKLIDQMMGQFAPRIDREAATNINRIDTSAANLIRDMKDIERQYNKGRELGYIPPDAEPLSTPEWNSVDMSNADKSSFKSGASTVIGKGVDNAHLIAGAAGAYGLKKGAEALLGRGGAAKQVAETARQAARKRMMVEAARRVTRGAATPTPTAQAGRASRILKPVAQALRSGGARALPGAMSALKMVMSPAGLGVLMALLPNKLADGTMENVTEEELQKMIDYAESQAQEQGVKRDWNMTPRSNSVVNSLSQNR